MLTLQSLSPDCFMFVFVLSFNVYLFFTHQMKKEIVLVPPDDGSTKTSCVSNMNIYSETQ